MLGERRVPVAGCDVEESWVEWIQRSTHKACEAASRAGVVDWVQEQRRRKWQWCGKVCRMERNRWALIMMEYVPKKGSRNVGRPRVRWVDSINGEFATPGDYILYAYDEDTWNELFQ